MNPVVRFMSSTAGQATRIVAGLALIAIGGLAGGAGWILAAVGVIPLLAGVFDVCLFAPLFKQPFSGRTIRNS